VEKRSSNKKEKEPENVIDGALFKNFKEYNII
jgi:hypothetical protein